MASLKNKSILVTGGAGFIGSHVVDAIIKEQPEKLVVASNFFLGKMENLIEAKNNFPGLKIVKQDMSDLDGVEYTLNENPVDMIFNLAVVPLPTSHVRPKWTYLQNVLMTAHLLELARKNVFKTLIQFSSSEVYGTAKYVPMDEAHPLDPTTPYAASKAATDQMTISYHRTFGLDMSIIRPFNTYGPRQNARGFQALFPLTLSRILNNEDLAIYGDGKQTRDWIYVEDTARAAVEVAKHESTRGKIINIASGKETSINEIMRLIVEHTGYSKPIVYKEARAADVRRHFADTKLAKELVGFEPKYSIEEGVRKTVDWYLQHKEVF